MAKVAAKAQPGSFIGNGGRTTGAQSHCPSLNDGEHRDVSRALDMPQGKQLNPQGKQLNSKENTMANQDSEKLLLALELAWRAGYGEAIRRMANNESVDEQKAWDSVDKKILQTLLDGK